MATLPPGTIWLASYPKSGNTWLRVLFANLIKGGDSAAKINDLEGKSGVATSRKAIEDLTLLDTTLLTLAETERLRPLIHAEQAALRTGAAFVKTHDAFVRLPDGTPVLGQSARAALYIVRDPRDVAVSYAHHQDWPAAKAIEQLNDAEDVFANLGLQIDYRQLGWRWHVESWIDQRDVPVCLIRYEDLLADGVGEFGRILDFIGADCSRAEIELAVRHSSFETLQRQETEKGFRERMSRDSLFFRRGRAGGWRDELSAELAAEVERVNADVMARLGYEVGVPT